MHGIVEEADGRAVMTVDFDNNGSLDLLLTTQSGPVRLYRNEIDPGARWIYGIEADVQGTSASESFAGTFTSNLVGINPGGNIGRSLSGAWTVERQWQVSLRGRAGYTWDRTAPSDPVRFAMRMLPAPGRSWFAPGLAKPARC